MTDAPHRALWPAEWVPQAGVMLTWPRPDGDWGPVTPQAEQSFAAIATVVSRRETCLIVAADEPHVDRIRGVLIAAGTNLASCRYAIAPSDDAWARDHRPITVRLGDQLILNDFRFDGWGGRHRCGQDDAITAALHKSGAFGDIARRRCELVVEGGAVETDGQGTLLATRSSVLPPCRNPDASPNSVTDLLNDALGIERFLWLDHGELAGDDTDGHIDTLARFTDARTIVHQSCDDPDDPNYPCLQAMRHQLARFERPDGARYRTVPLPTPNLVSADGAPLPAGYTNFLIINEAVLVPVYEHPSDTPALERLAGCFPDRELIPIPCRALVREGGSLHCVTMQIPAGVELAGASFV